MNNNTRRYLQTSLNKEHGLTLYASTIWSTTPHVEQSSNICRTLRVPFWRPHGRPFTLVWQRQYQNKLVWSVCGFWRGGGRETGVWTRSRSVLVYKSFQIKRTISSHFTTFCWFPAQPFFVTWAFRDACLLCTSPFKLKAPFWSHFPLFSNATRYLSRERWVTFCCCTQDL